MHACMHGRARPHLQVEAHVNIHAMQWRIYAALQELRHVHAQQLLQQAHSFCLKMILFHCARELCAQWTACCADAVEAKH